MAVYHPLIEKRGEQISDDEVEPTPNIRGRRRGVGVILSLSLLTVLLLIVLIILVIRSPSRLLSDAGQIHFPQASTNSFILTSPVPKIDEKSGLGDIMKDLDIDDYYSAIPPERSTPWYGPSKRYAILLPTFTSHFPVILAFFQSMQCLCVDHDEVDIHLILSDSREVQALKEKVAQLPECNATFSRFEVPESNRNHRPLKLNFINLYDILPPLFKKEDKVTANDTSILLQKYGRFKYQSIKKWAAALQFDYDYAMWLDSEAVAVQPFSIRDMFDIYLKAPTVFRSRMSRGWFDQAIQRGAAKMLGRDLASFGDQFWTLESPQWIIEKAIVNDLVRYVTDAYQDDFYKVWMESGGPFEINAYYMHIFARKLETVNGPYSKYRVVETEREMLRFGLGDTLSTIAGHIHGGGPGLLERPEVLLKPTETHPNFSAFLRQYGQAAMRLEHLDVTTPEAMDQFLLETPIYMLICGAPPLHQWWTKRFGNITISSDA